MLNGMLAPPLMIIILLVANNKTIMAGHTNGWLLNSLGVAATAIMLASTVVLLFQLAESALGG
jgi:Mn2+/Fe2+ NRAMP family transporter